MFWFSIFPMWISTYVIFGIFGTGVCELMMRGDDERWWWSVSMRFDDNIWIQQLQKCKTNYNHCFVISKRYNTNSLQCLQNTLFPSYQRMSPFRLIRYWFKLARQHIPAIGIPLCHLHFWPLLLKSHFNLYHQGKRIFCSQSFVIQTKQPVSGIL